MFASARSKRRASALIGGTGLASTTALLQDSTISLSDAFTRERKMVESQVGAINGTVTELQKLSAIDPELLEPGAELDV